MQRTRIAVALLITGLAAALIPLVAAESNRRAARADGQHLEGSWNLTATIEGQPLIHALITYSRDGSFVETAAAPGVSTGHGVWSRTGNRKFALTNVYLRLDEAGQFLGTAKVRADFQLNETLDDGGGRFQTDVFDVDGTLVDTFGGTAQARRIQVEPLQ